MTMHIKKQEGTTSMKQRITKLMTTAMMLPIAALIAGAVVPVMSAYAVDCEITNGLTGSAECARGTGQAESLTGDTGVFITVTNILLFIIGAIAVIMLVIGGIRYTISNGDSNAVSAAKNTIMYAIIGIIVAILAYAAVNFVIVSFAGTTGS